MEPQNLTEVRNRHVLHLVETFLGSFTTGMIVVTEAETLPPVLQAAGLVGGVVMTLHGSIGLRNAVTEAYIAGQQDSSVNSALHTEQQDQPTPSNDTLWSRHKS